MWILPIKGVRFTGERISVPVGSQTSMSAYRIERGRNGAVVVSMIEEVAALLDQIWASG